MRRKPRNKKIRSGWDLLSPSRRTSERPGNRDFDNYEIEEYERSDNRYPEEDERESRYRYKDSPVSPSRRTSERPGNRDYENYEIEEYEYELTNERFPGQDEPERNLHNRKTLSRHNRGAGTDARNARDLHMKRDRSQRYHARKAKLFPSRGSANYKRRYRVEEDLHPNKPKSYKGTYNTGHRHEDRYGYAIRKGPEVFLPGYEDEEFFDQGQKTRHVSLRRGADNYPQSFVNENYMGGLPDEDYYEERDLDLYNFLYW